MNKTMAASHAIAATSRHERAGARRRRCVQFSSSNHRGGQPNAASTAGEWSLAFRPSPTAICTIGHAKSICLNFGLARENGGRCHLRFDDTNPIKEDVEYEDSIKAAVRWLGFDWGAHRYHASDYFDRLYEFARQCSSRPASRTSTARAPDEMRALRGTLTEAGTGRAPIATAAWPRTSTCSGG